MTNPAPILPERAGRRFAALGARVRALPHRNEVAMLAALLLSTRLLPRPPSAGIYGIGVVNGATLALQGIALVLIYRSNRIVNFAQASFALAAGTLFSALVQYRSLLRLVEPLCVSSCLDSPLGVQLNYWLSLALALGLAVLLGWLTYVVVVRRFASAPRLVLTVATIFVGSVATGIVSQLVTWVVPSELQEGGGPPPGSVPAPLPFDLVVRVGDVRFHAVHIVTVAAAIVAAAWLFLYLRRSATGTAISASADNRDRAEMLGVNTSAMASRVWVLSAAIAGMTGVLSVMAQGGGGATAGVAEIYILAVAVIARMTDLRLVAVAALVLGVVQQAVQWSFSSTVLLDGTLFLLIGVLLLLQSGRATRVDQALVGEWQAADEVRPIPDQLRGLPAVRGSIRFGIAAIVVVLLGFPWATPPSTTSFATAVVAYVMIGLSLLVLTGWAGQISLGQVAFAGIGAYVAAVTGLPFPLALILGGLAGAAAAILIGIPALRLRGFHLAVMTLAFHHAVVSVGLNPRYLGAALPPRMASTSFLGLDLRDPRVVYYVALAVAALVTVAVVGMARSRTARALIAMRDNEQAAQSFGIPLTRVRVGAFAVSGFIAAVAGVVLAFQLNGVKPAAFDLGLSRTIFLHVVIGGLGTVAGPAIGMTYYALPQLFAFPGVVGLLMSGPGALMLLLMTRGGLGQLLFAARDSWLRRVARRHRIVVPSLVADLDASRAEDRVALAPKVRPGGGTAFVPARYELAAQWAVAPGGDAQRDA